MIVREPVVAGQFYAAEADRCKADVERMLDEASTDVRWSGSPVAGLVPHAGWVCSGAVAAQVFKVLAKTADAAPDVIVLFGGVHRYRGKDAALFARGRWETPLGPVAVDERLAERILGHTNLIVDDPHAHADEHSIEVQVPFVRHLFPQAKVVPIMVPISSKAPEVGEAVGRTLSVYKCRALIVGTTDLTHYGPRYGFSPRGTDDAAHAWAKEDNDRRFIDLVCDMKAAELVSESLEHRNACNAGAAAATITAAAALGATDGVLLQHTTSREVLAGKVADLDDSVGYAGVIFV
ncbi:MAG: AmmeMemoRadiSam system protein B [Phycisphaerae bacterium]